MKKYESLPWEGEVSSKMWSNKILRYIPYFLALFFRGRPQLIHYLPDNVVHVKWESVPQLRFKNQTFHVEKNAL